MRRTLTRTAAALLALGLAGCTEYASIRSGPSGATVTVDGKAAGKTPLQYPLSRRALDQPHEVHIELDGFQPATASLKTRLAKGRVTGALFTLGLVALFRSMYYVEPVFVQLQPLQPYTADTDRALGEALRNLRELHRQGKISDAELERRREELLQ